MLPKLKALEMRLRARVPEPVRRSLRVIAAMRATVRPLPELPEDLVENCRLCSSRYRLLDLIGPGGTAVELGTYKGTFARQILQRAKPRVLHVVDIDYSLFDASLLSDPRLVKHEGLTHEVIATFPDASLDWAYIDADHSETGALRDARATAPKIKPGGLIVFNDFAHIDPRLGRYGVHAAVVRFMTEARWPMAYFAYEGDGLYDVALRRPAAT